MRRLVIFGMAGVGAALLATAVQAQPSEMPGRRAGQWETKMSGMGPRGDGMTMRMCVDPATEHSFQPYNGPMNHGPGGQSDCSKHEAHRIADGWAFSSVCTRRGETVTSSGTVTGDFQSHYRVEINVQGSGPPRHMTMESTWLGSCPAGGGNSMVMPDGRVINMPHY